MNDLENINNKVLAAQVVIYKTLGINRPLAIQCLTELERRKNQGDEFDFESFINSEVKKIPIMPESNLNLISQLMNEIKGKK